MILPPKFEADIQGSVLNIITRVIITYTPFVGDEEKKIRFSTHSMNFEGNYYPPMLLNIPSMKESIDIENRNFKISNISIDVNNFENEGVRFSTM